MVNNSGSQLAQMIAQALAAKTQDRVKTDTMSQESNGKLDDSSTYGPAVAHVVDQKATEPDMFTTMPDNITAKTENEIVFSPVSPGQFGEPGNGSKFLEAIQNFDLSKYSLETDGDYSTLIGIGSAALLAIGAIAAVPVAPIILRRTGTSGWGGLPSFSELWGWWSKPDPQAEKFANNQYNGNNYINREYDYAPNQANQYDNNQYDNNQYDNSQYEKNQYDNNQYDNSQYENNQYDNNAWYSDYYDSGSSPSQTSYQYEPESDQEEPSEQYNRNNGPGSSGQAHRQRNTGQAHRQRNTVQAQPKRPHQGGNRQPSANNRRNKRPQQDPERTQDGHEYTTVEELNKLGEDSLKTIYEQFSAHMVDPQNFYQDNELRRRYDEYAYMERQGQILPEENSYEQSLMRNTKKLSRDYLQHYAHQESEQLSIEDEPLIVREFPYDWEITETE
ncbi:unnamed protein product [Meganyctiphanes norvegica]|uniref:Uncharacterized protein n=1 Tax=Meganyctiphanes norvegica TaxID=48144 RepID=A0AAV2RE50_MEGNR